MPEQQQPQPTDLGIELEFYPLESRTHGEILGALAEVLGEDKVYPRVLGYVESKKARYTPYWRLVYDGSLEYHGIELVSAKFAPWEEIRAAVNCVRLFTDLDRMKRSTECGYHVHIGLSHKYHFKRHYDIGEQFNESRGRHSFLKSRNLKEFDLRLHENYGYFQPVFDALVSRSRRVSGPSASSHALTYCPPVNDEYLDTTIGGRIRKEDYMNDRSFSAPFDGNRGVVNLTSNLTRHGTVEFRQHGGTMHWVTVKNWAKLMQRIVARSWSRETKDINPRDYPITVDGLADFLGLGQNRLRAWMKKRANTFNFSAIAGAESNTANPAIARSSNNPSDRFRANLENAGVDIEAMRRDLGMDNQSQYRSGESLTNEIILMAENDVYLYDTLRMARTRAERMGGETTDEAVREIVTNWNGERTGTSRLWGDWERVDWYRINHMLIMHELC